MRILPYTLLALCLAAPAKADKFWLGDPADKRVAEGSQPNFVEGVLLAESAEGYHVRIVGGEVLLPKHLVFKVEKDTLTIDAIVQQEQAAAKGLAEADEARRTANAAIPRQRTRGGVQAAEAAAKRSEAAPAPASADRVAPAAEFDPVVGRIVPGTVPSHADLLAEAQRQWSLTKDRRYLNLLRKLRRLN
jgi:hypothetical protein